MIYARQSRHGFTLLELLLSMALGMMVLILAITLLGRSVDHYECIGGGVSAERESRAVLTQLTADLSCAHFHKDGVFEQSAADWPLDNLGFLSLQARDAQSTAGQLGDLCAIHYYSKDLLINGKTVRCLMRGFRDSHATFTALRDGQTPTLFSATERDEPVAFGILSFEARPLTRDTSGHWQAWEKSAAHAPEAVAVRLVIARRDLVSKLGTTAAWNGNGATAGLLGRASQAGTNPRLEVYAALIRFGHPTPAPTPATTPAPTP
ncbi:MAG: prepilin-type N-terminal cleavage/methylation domain-containing protein, partial [Verrucomicrobiota bacterium]